MNTQQMMEEIDRLARLCEANDAEKAAWEDLNNKLCWRNEELHKQLSEAQAQIAMQAEALNPFAALLQEHNKKGANNRPVFAINDAVITLGDLRKATEVISATAETIAAFRAKETEPYKREVAMLLDAGNHVIENLGKQFHTNGADDFYQVTHSVVAPLGKACDDTQSTALAYELEVKAKALEEAANNLEESEETPYSNMASTQLLRMAAELRAANKGE